MPSGTSATDQKKKADSLVGRSYLCCAGPRKGQAITVTAFDEMAARYTLEGERGGTWTISDEKLRRIFGKSKDRRCGCYPLDEESVKAVEDVIEETPGVEITPKAAVIEIEEEKTETTEIVEAIDQPPADAAPIQQVKFEANNAQGSLF